MINPSEFRPVISSSRRQLLEQLLRNHGSNPRAPIAKLPRDQSPLEASYAQLGVWLSDQKEPGNTAFNLPISLRIRGAVNLDALKKSLNAIIVRHEVLRTRLIMHEGILLQQVEKAGGAPLFMVNLRHLPEHLRTDEAVRLTVEEVSRPFDLQRGPLIRSTVICLDDLDHVLLVTLHHAICDGWSLGVLFTELRNYYTHFVKGAMPKFSDLPLQYADYAAWQRSGALDSSHEYWKQKLAGELPILSLPRDRARPAIPTVEGEQILISLKKETVNAVRAMSRTQNVTVYMTLLACFKILLQRYTNMDDILIGSTVTGRTRVELEGMIGLFVNMLPLRTDLSGDPSFSNLLHRVREVVTGAQLHQDMPYERLLHDTSIVQRSGRNSLFNVVFDFNNIQIPGPVLDELEVTRFKYLPAKTARYDLMLTVFETTNEISAVFEYSKDLFEASTVARMSRHFLTIVDEILEDIEEPISSMQNFPPDVERLLDGWNKTEYPYPDGMCIHDLVEHQVVLTPDTIAIVDGDRQITYQELNAQANRMAHYLRDVGIAPESIVAVCLDRSIEMIVALLGILKAGAAYAPIDVHSPRERIAFMLTDLASPLVVTQRSLTEIFENTSSRVIYADELSKDLSNYNSDNMVTSVSSANVAYVIYTSGSTGHPKGVMIEHRNTVALLSWGRKTYSRAELSGVLAGTSICFDISIFEIFLPLCVGGAAILVCNPLELAELPARDRVTLINTVPSVMVELLRADQIPQSVRTVNLAGEFLPADLVNAVYSLPHIERVYDLYGPSEDTTFTTSGLRLTNSWNHIGRPIDNTRLYILDTRLRSVPIGVSGELYIAGKGLSRGYLHRPALTAECFIPNPFSSALGERLYRTGDIVRYLDDGTLEYLGRNDHQVKVRGFRIELGEIEAELRRHADVSAAVVLACDDERGMKHLVAYIVFSRDGCTSTGDLRLYLRRHLPAHMVPSVLVPLHSLPLNSNGKIDRNALPPPPVIITPIIAQTVPRTQEEKALVRIWADIIQLPHVGIEDNFFDLGGHSLLAARIISRVRQEFHAEISFRAIWENPTIAELARMLQHRSRREQDAEALLVPKVRGEAIPLSFSQERLWFLDRLQPGNSFYNMAGAFKLGMNLNVSALQRAVEEIISRHEILRTRFLIVDGSPTQCVDAPFPAPISIMELSDLGTDSKRLAAHDIMSSESQRPFDLEVGPLLRFNLLNLGDDGYLLHVNVHHIIADGWSLGILKHEFTILYNAYCCGEIAPLAPLPIQYADYAIWQRRKENESTNRQLAYWRDKLGSVPPYIEVPADFPRPAELTHRGRLYSFHLPQDTSRGLLQLGRGEGASLFMVLMAALYVLLARLTSQEDLVIGTPVANRGHIETENLIGFFVNTLALRTKLSGNPTFSEITHRVRETVLEAFTNQDVPFEKIVEDLALPRHLNRSPLFQVMLVLQNTPDTELTIDAEDVTNLEISTNSSKYDLTLFAREKPSGLELTFEYSNDLFMEQTIELLADRMAVVCRSVVSDPNTRLSSIDIRADSEKRLLKQWAGISIQGGGQFVHQMFEELAAAAPQSNAVIFGTDALTYGELNARANRLASHLVVRGIGPEHKVAIYLDKSSDFVISILAVMKAGGTYVPMDPAHPQSRSAYILKDSSCTLVMTSRSFADRFAGLGLLFVELEGESSLEETYRNPNVPVCPDNAAYVIYTSGSSGRPKGVVVSYGALQNSNAGRFQCYQDEVESYLMVSPFPFDSSIAGIFWTLASGGTLVLPSTTESQDPLILATLINDHQVSHVLCVPSMYEMLLANASGRGGLKCLKVSIVAGETCPQSLCKLHRALLPNTKLYNEYGPTEAAVWSTVYEYVGDVGGNSVPIGKPIPQVGIHVLDTRGEPSPIGVPGELYIRGANLARGYIDDPLMTADRFVPDPFSDTPGARMYRTGDRARYLHDGNVSFLGRLDDQIKIRGFRIEPAEIETTLREHPAIEQCIVHAWQDDTGMRLVAYVIGSDKIDDELIRSFLAARLPAYMVPYAIIQIDALPLSANSKLDYQALPRPTERTATRMDRSSLAAVSELEHQIAKIWSEVLRVDSVDIRDNFFSLGGHSILLARVQAKMIDSLGIEVTLLDLFRFPTIGLLAKWIETPLEHKSNSTPELPSARNTRLPRDRMRLQRERRNLR